jgi:hypothetical protein
MIRDLGFQILGAPDVVDAPNAMPADVALKSRDERLGPRVG